MIIAPNHLFDGCFFSSSIFYGNCRCVTEQYVLNVIKKTMFNLTIHVKHQWIDGSIELS